MGNSVKLTWHTEKRRLGDLIEWDKNPRQLKDHDAEHLKKSLDNFGVADPLIINTDNRIIGGHMRRRIMLQSGYKPDDLVDVRVPERELTEREAEELAIRLNKNTGDWDFDALANNSFILLLILILEFKLSYSTSAASQMRLTILLTCQN